MKAKRIEEDNEFVVSDVSQVLETRPTSLVAKNRASRRKLPALPSHHYDVENLLGSSYDEGSSGDDDDDDVSILCNASREEGNKKTGTELLRELNAKLANATSIYLNGQLTNAADEEATENKKQAVTAPSMLTVNTSNMFLNDNEIKKRKTKFLK